MRRTGTRADVASLRGTTPLAAVAEPSITEAVAGDRSLQAFGPGPFGSSGSILACIDCSSEVLPGDTLHAYRIQAGSLHG